MHAEYKLDNFLNKKFKSPMKSIDADIEHGCLEKNNTSWKINRFFIILEIEPYDIIY